MKKIKRILLLYRTFGPSVNLCCYAQLEWLAKEKLIDFRHKKITSVSCSDLNWANIVIFVRGDGLLDELVAKICHKAGKYVIYMLDDDLLNVPESAGSGPYYAQESVKRHISRMMEYGDCLASPSKRLCDKYSNRFSESFLIHVPSTYRIREKTRWNDGKVHIGFAGSSDRGADIDGIVSEALCRITKRYSERVIVEFFGVRTETAKKLGCKTYLYMEDYDEYQNKMKELNWDIGLAPMPETDFHSCKHYNKLIEYCGFGIAGIYSNVPPYSDSVEQNVTGILCDNTTEAWTNALTRLIEDRKLLNKISENCIYLADSIFSLEYAAKELENEIDKLNISNSGRKIVEPLWWIKCEGIISWLLEKIKKYGWKTPFVAAKKIIYLLAPPKNALEQNNTALNESEHKGGAGSET